MVRPTDVLHMYHDEEDDEICEINQIGMQGAPARNSVELFFFVCFIISFAIVPEVSITLVMQ